VFGVYLLYIKREREKDRITDVRLFMQTKRKQKILTHIHMYAYVCVCALVCHRKPICRRALTISKIF